MDNGAGAKTVLPDKMPAELFKQLRELGSDHARLKQFFLQKHGAFKSKNGKSFEYHLFSNGAKLTVKAYEELFLRLFPNRNSNRDRWTYHIVLVAVGPGITGPVILGRSQNLGQGKLRVWRGQDGFDETEEGLVLKSTAAEDSSDDSDDNDAEDHAADADAASEILSRFVTTPSSRSLTRPSTIGRLNNSQPSSLATSKPSTTAGTGALEAVASPGVVICFINDQNMITREKPLAACNTIKALFAQAVCAKIVDSKDEHATVNAGVGKEDVPLLRGDEDDFETLRRVVEKKMESWDDGVFEVYVRAL